MQIQQNMTNGEQQMSYKNKKFIQKNPYYFENNIIVSLGEPWTAKIDASTAAENLPYIVVRSPESHSPAEAMATSRYGIVEIPNIVAWLSPWGSANREKKANELTWGKLRAAVRIRKGRIYRALCSRNELRAAVLSLRIESYGSLSDLLLLFLSLSLSL